MFNITTGNVRLLLIPSYVHELHIITVVKRILEQNDSAYKVVQWIFLKWVTIFQLCLNIALSLNQSIKFGVTVWERKRAKLVIMPELTIYDQSAHYHQSEMCANAHMSHDLFYAIMRLLGLCLGWKGLWIRCVTRGRKGGKGRGGGGGGGGEGLLRDIRWRHLTIAGT